MINPFSRLLDSSVFLPTDQRGLPLSVPTARIEPMDIGDAEGLPFKGQKRPRFVIHSRSSAILPSNRPLATSALDFNNMCISRAKGSRFVWGPRSNDEASSLSARRENLEPLVEDFLDENDDYRSSKKAKKVVSTLTNANLWHEQWPLAFYGQGLEFASQHHGQNDAFLLLIRQDLGLEAQVGIHTQNEQRLSPLPVLPNEVIEIVFEQLCAASTSRRTALSALAQLKLVCTNWRSLASRVQARYIMKQDLPFAVILGVTSRTADPKGEAEKAVALAQTLGTDLLHLNLKRFRHIDDVLISELVKSCPKLKHIALESDLMKIPGQKCLTGLENLESLTFLRCTQLKKTAFAFVMNKMPSLRKLEVLDSRVIKDDWFVQVAPHRGLRALDLSWCDKITGVALEKVAHAFPALEELTLTNCKGIVDGDLAEVAHFKALRKLNLSDNKQLTQDGLTTLASINVFPASKTKMVALAYKHLKILPAS